jgi:hypothetical protein
MKKIKFILLAVFAAGIGVACSEDKDSTDEAVRQEELRRIAALENALLGQWMEVSPTTDGCVISFMDGELIFNRNIYGGFNDTLSCTYQVVSGDLVQIAIGDRSAGYKVTVSDNDNIVIKDFIPSDAAVYPPQYADIELKRLSQGEEENAKDCEWTKLTSVSVEGQLKTTLDNVFSDNNELLKVIKSDTLFVINNREEIVGLQGFSEYPDRWMEFDWNNQCIIGGKIQTSSVSDEILSQQLSECLNQSLYVYEIEVKKCTDCYWAIGYHYFWAVYPRKIDAKNVSLTIKTKEEPNEILFEDYSLAGTSCQWTKLNNNDEAVVINSNEELNRYVTCTDNDYPAIDFSKYTLLLAHGTGTSSVVSVGCSRLQQISEQGYTMNVDIVLGNATVMSPWQVPIIVDKWREGSTLELTVTIKYD